MAAFVAGGCASTPPAASGLALPVPQAYVTELHATPARAEGSPAARPSPLEGGEPAAPDHRETATAAQRADMRDPGALWWTAFSDPALDATIQEAIHNNYLIRDLRTLIYENELDPARPNGVLWPLQIGPTASAVHSALAAPPALGAQGYRLTYDQADVGLTATYEVDVWGKLRAQRRTLDDIVEQQRQNTEVAAQSVAEQVALWWFEILEQRALKALLETQVRDNRDLLEIVKARFEQHLAPRLAVLQQEQLLLNTQAQVPLIAAQLALLDSKLTTLLGRMPTPNADLVPEDRRLPDLPPAPALGTPADLRANSPEMRVARAKVAEADHLVSQNHSDWLPTIELFGNAGVRSYNFSENFTIAAGGIRLTWPLFDGGRRIIRAQQLELTVQRRNWQYDLALKTAIQRVQDALIQEQRQTDNLQALRAQVDLGRRVLVEARQLFEQGLSDYLPVLTARASLSTLERAALQAQRALLAYRVQLYHALGGTWSRAATKQPAD